MNKNKYYKVKEIKDSSGNCEFKVFACDNWFEYFFGIWTEYTKKNKTLDEAIDQINTLVSWKIVKDKIVYKRKVK